MSLNKSVILEIAILIATSIWSISGCTKDTEPSNQTASVITSQSSTSTSPAGLYQRHLPPAAKEWVDQRRMMVETQIAHPRDGRKPVKNPFVLEAMRTVPRHAFVPPERQHQAYMDNPLPIGHKQTISQPYIVAYMTELLKLTKESKVLEIGTGSGYQAAVLAHLTPHVFTIEIIAPLAERAKNTFRQQGYTEIQSRRADGYKGWPEEAPFDAIIVTFAADHVPQPLWEQLKPGGRMVIPLGKAYGNQNLYVITKTTDGKKKMKPVMGVRFVPMLREEQ